MRLGRSSINVYPLGGNRMRKNQMSSKLENVDSRYPRRNCFPRTWNSRHQQLWESLSEPLAQFKRSIFPLGLSHRLSQFVSRLYISHTFVSSQQASRREICKFVPLNPIHLVILGSDTWCVATAPVIVQWNAAASRLGHSFKDWTTPSKLAQIPKGEGTQNLGTMKEWMLCEVQEIKRVRTLKEILLLFLDSLHVLKMSQCMWRDILRFCWEH